MDLLQWTTQNFDDLSGCWLAAKIWDIEFNISAGPGYGHYELAWLRTQEDEASFCECNSIEEAKSLAEDIATQLLCEQYEALKRVLRV